MAVNGGINVLPSLVREYSTAMDFDLVARLAISPVDSRLRSVLVSIRWETFPRRRRSCPWRWGPSCREDMILTVHLPMKIVETIFDPIPSFLFILFSPPVNILPVAINSMQIVFPFFHFVLLSRLLLAIPLCCKREHECAYLTVVGFERKVSNSCVRRLAVGTTNGRLASICANV